MELKEIHQKIKQNIDSLADFCNYSLDGWTIDLPESLIENLRKLDEKYESIISQKEDFIFNHVHPNNEQNDLINLVLKDNFYLQYPDPKDFLSVLKYIENGFNVPPELSSQDNPISILKKRKFRMAVEAVREFYASDFKKVFKITPMKVGKFIKKLYPDATAQECENFQQLYTTYFDHFNYKNVTVVKDVMRFYHDQNYTSVKKTGPLFNSCMKHSEDLVKIRFYEENDVELAIFPDPDEPNKIRARALIWNNVKVPEVFQKKYNLPETITFMDRPYFTQEIERLFLQTYALKNNIYYKSEACQGWSGITCPDGKIITENIHLTYPLKNAWTPFYPYVDTLRYMYHSVKYNQMVLSSHIPEPSEQTDNSGVLELISTGGKLSGNCNYMPTDKIGQWTDKDGNFHKIPFFRRFDNVEMNFETYELEFK